MKVELEKRSEERKKIMVTRKIRRGSDDKKEFDREFWKNAGAEAKFAAAWEMVNEHLLIRGKKDAGQQRLQRSVQNIKRRKS
ncbi:MAG: hypothetical protein KAW12_10980 [Candidatus Aminicenantes bacterium]|nr:hypothetical protein [Candidatus Aminicenantes bacterium]